MTKETPYELRMASHAATLSADHRVDICPSPKACPTLKGFLTQALEAEWRGRHQRGVESRLKLARLPWVKTLDQFDFEFQPSIDRKQSC